MVKVTQCLVITSPCCGRGKEEEREGMAELKIPEPESMEARITGYDGSERVIPEWRWCNWN